MFFKYLVIVAAATLATNAQSATSSSGAAVPSGLTPCIIDCSTQAASSAGCSSYADLPCVCTSTAFQTAAGACLQANCTAAEVQAAQQLQTTECASLSSSTASGASSSLLTSTSATTHASSSSTSATSSGAATGLVSSLSLDNAFGGLVALAGALIGAALVL